MFKNENVTLEGGVSRDLRDRARTAQHLPSLGWNVQLLSFVIDPGRAIDSLANVKRHRARVIHKIGLNTRTCNALT
jgi:hypothetical protein